MFICIIFFQFVHIQPEQTNSGFFVKSSSSRFPPGLRVEQELVTSYPQVVVVRVPTPWVQSDSDITVLRHLEKMGCRLINRPQAILNCVNKFWTFQELAGHGVPLPDTFSYGKSMLDVCPFHSVGVLWSHRVVVTKTPEAARFSVTIISPSVGKCVMQQALLISSISQCVDNKCRVNAVIVRCV